MSDDNRKSGGGKGRPRVALVLIGTAMALRVDLPGVAPVPRGAVSKVCAQKGDVLIAAAPKVGRIDPLLAKP